MSKYNAKNIEIDGIIFHSKHESIYYEQLKWLKLNKMISNFELQPKYLLQESFKKNGKTFRKIEYIADFLVFNLDGTVEVIDIKGMITTDFAIKRKLFEKRYPNLSLKMLVYKKKYGGFVEYDEYLKLKRAEKKK